MGEEGREIRAKVISSPTAFEQMEALTARYIEKVLKWCELLALFPFAGAQMTQDDLTELRRVVVAPLIVIYEYDSEDQAVHVLWIQHGRRLAPTKQQLGRARDV